ncbi:MAG: nicotinamide mononucleotide transporter [Ruminococcus sp.]|nr:nicotinamide mononucleotide transporter [Ruminococcus sp.]
MKYLQKIASPFKDLTAGERFLLTGSAAAIILSFLLSGGGSFLETAAALIGSTALVFVSKGYVLGQALTVVFALFYGAVSYGFHYYGEMLTYMCMTAPIAAAAVVSWLRNPYEGTRTVRVARVTKNAVCLLTALSAAVTAAFCFILKALGNANLFFSTLSVFTSFMASGLTFLRSPYYALGYSANDIILIVLWVMASRSDSSYLPMVCCFAVFLVNDLYGFFNWRRLRDIQQKD